MTTHPQPTLLAFFFGILSLTASAFADRADDPRPNIVFLFADDFGLDMMGGYGSDQLAEATPTMDTLAVQGIQFMNGYVTPKCGPSRAAWSSGQYPFRNGVLGQSLVDTKFKAASGATYNVANALNAAQPTGYITGMAGRSDGFGDYDETLAASNYYTTSFRLDGDTQSLDHVIYDQDFMLDYALDFFERHQDTPFFWYHAFKLVHVPMDAPPALLIEKGFPWVNPDGGIDTAGYLAAHPGKTTADLIDEIDAFSATLDKFDIQESMIKTLDAHVAAIVAKLEALDLRENTLIVFAGDNGSANFTGIPFTIDGRRVDGGKNSLQDGGSHVPFWVSWPAGIDPAATGQRDELMDLTDLFPTFAELADAPLPPQDIHKLDGHSLVGLMKNDPDYEPREFVFSQLHLDWFVRGPDYRLSRDGTFWDMSDAPFSMTLVPEDTTDPDAIAAREKLTAILAELDVWSGPTIEAALDGYQNNGYWDWKLSHWPDTKVAVDGAITASQADPDSDGIPNLFEHAWGLDPTVKDAKPFTITYNGDAMEARMPASTDRLVDVRVEVSGDLTPGSWESGDPPVSIQNLNGELVGTDTGTGSSRFMRLRAVRTYAEPPGSAPITSVIASSLEPYEVFDLADGEKLYLDRGFTYGDVGNYAGLKAIRSANDDKTSRDPDFLRIGVDRSVTCHVLFDPTRGTPSWLATFQDSGDTIATSDKTLSVFSKTFPAGEIVLGSMGSTTGNQYTVLIE